MRYPGNYRHKASKRRVWALRTNTYYSFNYLTAPRQVFLLTHEQFEKFFEKC